MHDTEPCWIKAGEILHYSGLADVAGLDIAVVKAHGPYNTDHYHMI